MKRFLTLMLAAGFSFQGAASWSMTFACQMTGEVQTSCCCVVENSESCDVSIQAACNCCEVSFTEAASEATAVHAEIEVSNKTVASDSAVPYDVASTRSFSVGGFSIAAPRSNSPPGPLYVLNQAFLR